MNTETSLWKDTPSQWLNIGHFAASAIIAAAIIAASFVAPVALAAIAIPIAYAAWRYLVVRCQTFELTSQRLRISQGVINQHIDEIELYRVKDTLMTRTWWMRLTGLSSITLQTSDRSLPSLIIPAIPNGNDLREQLRVRVEAQRDAKRVREMDFDDASEATDLDA